MRFIAASWSALLAAAVCAVAATPPDSARLLTSPDPALHAEAVEYARNLKQIVETIGDAYIGEVPRADLYEAALAGLYETAREPVPASLRVQVRQGIETDILGLLVRIRESLGQPESLRGHRALRPACRLCRALDPYCGLTPRRDFQRLDMPDNMPNTGLEFVGVPLVPVSNPQIIVPGVPNDSSGLETPKSAPAGPLRVLNVQPGSPAQHAGIRPGDLIIRLDGLSPSAVGFPAPFQHLRPVQPGTPAESIPPPVRLTILRPGRVEPFDVTLALAVYRPESVFGARRKADGSWDYLLDPDERIGYVRIGGIRRGFREMFPQDEGHLYGSHREFRDALRSLEGSQCRGLVLDLRWCPGGYLTEAATIARLLLDPDQTLIARQRDRSGDKKRVVEKIVDFDTLDNPHTDFPVVVLINGETSGGGELIAAALQDYHRAVIAGQRTVGKASVQSRDFERSMGVPFKLSTGMFVRATGKKMHRFADSKPSDDWGVRPDAGRELPLTADAGRRLKEWWTLQMLRPPGATDALPLDDPENDPQRLGAVQMLHEIIKK